MHIFNTSGASLSRIGFKSSSRVIFLAGLAPFLSPIDRYISLQSASAPRRMQNTAKVGSEIRYCLALEDSAEALSIRDGFTKD